MVAKQSIGVVLIFTWFFQSTGLAAQGTGRRSKPGPLTWSELGSVVVEKKAQVKLTEGASVEGEVLAVRPEAIVMDVTKTSDKKMYPKGQTSIPRNSVKELRVIKEHGPGKLIGGILGTMGGIFTAGYMTAVTESAGMALTGFLLVVPAMAVGGYYLGKLADVRSTRINLADADGAAGGEGLQ